jgi:ABC-type phosphate/phosphonate transport system substrate-binding protein
MISSARMYEWAPSLIAAWRRLLEGVARHARVDLEFLDNRSVSLDDLWAREDMGCVFMCGYPYVRLTERPALLAAPVPSPTRFGGRPVYVTDFIVRADTPYARLEDTFGRCFAYSTEHSHSGYNAARYHLLPYRSATHSALFDTVKGPYVRQRAVIQAVLDGDADVTAIDGYAHDLLRRHDPAVAERLRVVATTGPAPSPPLVASPSMSAAQRERLTAALVTAHERPELAPVMKDLLLLRFERVVETDLQLFLDWERAAAAVGYAKIQ